MNIEILVAPESQSVVPRFTRFLLSPEAFSHATKMAKKHGGVATEIRTHVASLENCVGNQLEQ
jgi:hypothetical protein